QEGRMMAEMGLAFAAQKAGELDLAEKHLLNLLDGVPRGPAAEPALHLPTTLGALGHVAVQRGDWAAALELHREAYEAARKLGDPRTTAFTVEGMASALAAGGSHTAAARLLGLAAAARDRHHTPPVPSEQEDIRRVAGTCREALGDQAYTDEYDEGRRLELPVSGDGPGWCGARRAGRRPPSSPASTPQGRSPRTRGRSSRSRRRRRLARPPPPRPDRPGR